MYKPFVVIVAHLQDVSEECRMAAIESLYLESDSNIRALVSLFYIRILINSA